MKKIITLIPILLIWAAALSQPYVGIGVGSMGYSIHLGGVVVENIDISNTYEIPIFNQPISPSIQTLSVGYIATLLESDVRDTRLTLTPFVGVANYRTKALIDDDKKERSNKVVPALSIQLAKSSHAGSIILYASHANVLYFGVGLLVFPSKL